MVGQRSKVGRDSVSPLVSFAQPIVSSVVSIDELDDRLSAYSAVVWIQFSAFFSAVVHRRSSLIQFLAFFSAIGRSGSSSIWFSNHFSAVVVWFSNFFSTVIWVSQTSSQLDVVHHRAGFLRPICSVQIYSSSDRSN
ncbi:hypothetical protein LWI29_018806 [Acer saccharum]|uniref:Uncharacterized protein n=1 Tax=Acer saccharum TaxID=4024 RepID=A0AA39SM19_ACESA|nr:hypothetical protein LWI29_018806 [Acer saccharum]